VLREEMLAAEKSVKVKAVSLRGSVLSSVKCEMRMSVKDVQKAGQRSFVITKDYLENTLKITLVTSEINPLKNNLID
jgi:hypothetical protein